MTRSIHVAYALTRFKISVTYLSLICIVFTERILVSEFHMAAQVILVVAGAMVQEMDHRTTLLVAFHKGLCHNHALFLWLLVFLWLQILNQN